MSDTKSPLDPVEVENPGWFIQTVGGVPIVPKCLFVACAAIGLVLPFVARLPAVPLRGWAWFSDYLPGLGAVLFVSAFNLIPAGALFVAGKASKRAPMAFWFALAALIGFLLWAHGSINLRSSSTAVIGLIFIPINAVGVVALGWGVGRIAHVVARDDRGRAWMIGIAFTGAVAFGIGMNVNESVSIAKREAQFPVISVKEVPLRSRNVYPCSAIGRVEALTLGDFDTNAGKDLGVLGMSGIAVLDPSTYTVEFQGAFTQERCDRCVHMYPYLVPDFKGSFLVATSDGLSDSSGRLLWENKATGFSRVVPVQTSPGNTGFFAYDNSERVDFHNVEGKVLWTAKLPVESVGAYDLTDQQQLPFAIVRKSRTREIQIFSGGGAVEKTIPLPDWASNVQSIDWPTPGHLLVGNGSWFGVLDPSGKEVLRHVIQGTSFNPYHGPDGTAVRFRAAESPYLAVLSHGSSGYARSVLLIFDPTGRLVWQEELNTLRTIVAVPRPDQKGAVLLVGGMDGILEYALADPLPSSNTLEPGERKSGERGSP